MGRGCPRDVDGTRTGKPDSRETGGKTDRQLRDGNRTFHEAMGLGERRGRSAGAGGGRTGDGLDRVAHVTLTEQGLGGRIAERREERRTDNRGTEIEHSTNGII
jgi:hypothetical protein